ncbi:MAG TPA: aldehyde dehydrogenase family protein [Alphaproteobacteria bacterium]|nr:aldehyde dehydrogenase family protein [Alphaproteobacteria bacterium]
MSFSPNVPGASLTPLALVKHLENKLLLNGKLVAPKSKTAFPVHNPATMEVIGQAPEAHEDDINDAVESARMAQKEWRHMDAAKRGRLVSQCGDLLEDYADELARLLTLETGKALRTESQVETKVFTNTFRFYGGLGLELKGETIPFSDSMLTLTIREPLGVIGAIIAWNVPLLLMSLKVAPALVAGNTVVVKTAEEAPFAVLRAAEIMNSILPQGVLNVISGDGPTTGEALVRHPHISKVTFTGSVETGKAIYKNSSEKLIPVTLELGGKSPMIVCEDVDLEKVVDGAVASMRFTRQGQSCTAASRIFVHQSLFDDFLARFKEKLNALKIGDPMDLETDIGAVISPTQHEKILKYVEMGKKAEGATAYECSELPTDPKLSKGLFAKPVLFTGLPNSHQICQEEIFGPVTALIPWDDFDDVINQANDSPYGLAATLWTNNLNRALIGVHQLEAGFVQVNQNVVVQPGLSYGGVKSSGIGKEASLEAMLEHFTHKKTILFNME